MQNLPTHTVFPPGTILQQLYLKERFGHRRAGRFLEVGCGSGWVSTLLLRLGWSGIGLDLHEPSLTESLSANREFADTGRYKVQQGDFLDRQILTDEKFDLIISCKVIEHMDDASEADYFRRCRELCAAGGEIALIVPSSPRHWGIEDDTAGHCRRYTHKSLMERTQQLGWKVSHLAGLTFPISNLLLGLSNHLVRSAESHKLALPAGERTKLSGNRKVFLKTHLPLLFRLICNELTLWPFHLLQKYFRQHPACLVLYAECR
jgi:SAM-dependent methyltransferase